MPAAAVIPASVASIKVAAVKRLAVETQCRAQAGGRWSVRIRSRIYFLFRYYARSLREFACMCDKILRSRLACSRP